MGKRSRKRPAPDRPATTRAERDALRGTAPPRRATREKPPAPWGSFPLTELVVLLALILGVFGFISLDTHRGKVMVLAAMVLGSLGGLEVSIREHFAGYRSHSALLAGVCTIAVEAPLFFFVTKPPGLAVGLRLVVGVVVFGLAFHLLRRAFQRRTGGIGFRA